MIFGMTQSTLIFGRRWLSSIFLRAMSAAVAVSVVKTERIAAGTSTLRPAAAAFGRRASYNVLKLIHKKHFLFIRQPALTFKRRNAYNTCWHMPIAFSGGVYVRV